MKDNFSDRETVSENQLNILKMMVVNEVTASESGLDYVTSGIQQESYTVTELIQYLTEVFETDPVLQNRLIVRGELSNVKRSSRGHVYFTLKDQHSGISGIIWASLARSLDFDLEDGQDVYVTGQLEVYTPNGTYSLVAQKIEPVGIGSLQLAFQQIKERLGAEGLFLPELKQPLPEFPVRIGIVTSRTGAVIHDMLRVIGQKNAIVNVLLAPVKVQGQGAAEEIASALQELNKPEYGIDVILLARGGGAFEDLFCFSEEMVVRAIFQSKIPVITGIGHEPDFSLADAAADYSASTPTAAAEKAVPDIAMLKDTLMLYTRLLTDAEQQIILRSEQQFDQSLTYFLDSINRLFDNTEQHLGRISEQLRVNVQYAFQTAEHQFGKLASELNTISPLSTLARGYAIVTDANGHAIPSSQDTTIGQSIQVRFHDGSIHCEVIQHAKN